MTSNERLRDALTQGCLTLEQLRFSLGTVGMSAANSLKASLGIEKQGADKIGLYRLENITDPEIRKEFEANLAGYSKIFKGAGITMPTPEEMKAGGIDWRRLAELQKTHPNYDLVVAPLTMGAELLREMVNAVADDSSIPNNPFSGEYSLEIDVGFYGVWSKDMKDTRSKWQLPTCQGGRNRNGKPLTWTAFLIPSGDKPQDLGITYEQAKQQGIKLPPIAGYIAYQLKRICQGESPIKTGIRVEGGSHKWRGYSGFPSVYWHPDNACICIKYYYPFSEGRLNVLSPVG